MRELPVDIAESRWVEDQPTYQVHFWTKLNDPGPPFAPLWSKDAYRLAGVTDVHDVLEWAKARANGREIAIYAEVDRGHDRGDVRLVGVDPTRVAFNAR